MKKLIFALLLIAGTVQARQIILDIPDNDIKIVENDIVDAEQWIRSAWNGKLNKCKERLVNQEVARSVKDSEPLPAGDTAIVQKAFTRPDYKNRKDRDAFVVGVSTPEVIISTK